MVRKKFTQAATQIPLSLKGLISDVAVAMVESGFRNFEDLWRYARTLSKDPVLAREFENAGKETLREIAQGKCSPFVKGSVDYKKGVQTLAMLLNRDPAELFGVRREQDAIEEAMAGMKKRPVLPSEPAGPFGNYAQKQFQKNADRVIGCLSVRDQWVLDMYMGITRKPMKPAAVAVELGRMTGNTVQFTPHRTEVMRGLAWRKLYVLCGKENNKIAGYFNEGRIKTLPAIRPISPAQIKRFNEWRLRESRLPVDRKWHFQQRFKITP